MEELINQRFEYCRIKYLKPYSNIDKDRSKPIDDEWGTLYGSDKSVIDAPSSKESKKIVNRFYFLNDEHNFISLNVMGKPDGYVTQNDRVIRRNYLNPFVSIESIILERRITIMGDKIKITFNKAVKSRAANHKYFKKTSIKTVIIIDIKKGNFILGEVMGKGRARFKTNSFSKLRSAHLPDILFDEIRHIRNSPTIVEKFLKVFNDDEFFNKFISEVNVNVKYEFGVNLLKKIHEAVELNFIKNKKLKLPDNYVYLLTNFYPGERYFKRNDRKLIQSVLDMCGVKTPYVNKIIHKQPSGELIFFISQIKNVFGAEWEKYLPPIIESFLIGVYGEFHGNKTKHDTLNIRPHKRELTKKEKNNIVKIFKSNKVNGNRKNVFDLLSEINDHIKIGDDILSLSDIEDVTLKSTTNEKFQNEHSLLTKRLRRLNRDVEIRKVYSEELLRRINVDVEFDGILYNIKLLETQVEYENEGDIMRHCVASYITNKLSNIITIKEKGIDEGVTLEFQSHRLIQKKAKFNERPNERFNVVIEYVENIIKNFMDEDLTPSMERKLLKTNVTLTEDMYELINRERNTVDLPF